MDANIKAESFSWNRNFSEEAQEDFDMIRSRLPYCACQSIGLALAKLEILEAQGAQVEEETLNLNGLY